MKKIISTKAFLSFALPILYIIFLAIYKDPDFIIFKLGIFGIPIYLSQWAGFLIGGLVMAIIFNILFLSISGLLIGMLFDFVLRIFNSKTKIRVTN